MGPRLYRFLLCLLALFLTVTFPQPILENPAPPLSQLVFWNIGQGDFASVRLKSTCFIFDVGGNVDLPKRVRDWLKSCIKTSLFISHFDQDHIKNCVALSAVVRIDHAYFSHGDTDTLTGKRCLEALNSHHSKVEILHQGASIVQEDLKLKVVWPGIPMIKLKHENDRSLVVELQVDQKRILFTGDLPKTCEKKILKLGLMRPSDPPLTILKVGHHGSRTSSSLPFLKALKPLTCVISDGVHNKFGHPHKEALERLGVAGCAILRTDKLGDIKFLLE